LSNPWVREFWRMALLFGGALLLGWSFGIPLAMFTLALMGYLAWHLYNLYRLERWYSRRKKTNPPASVGIWGDAFYHIYQLQKSNRRRKKRLSSILLRFKESTAAMPDATIVLTNDDYIEWFNTAAKRYLGLKTKQDVGQRIDNLIRNPRFARYLAKEDFDEPLEIPSPVDPSNSLSLRIVPYSKNQKLLVVRNITRLKRLERMRSDFIANVSHELRTPLTVISGYLENIMDGSEQCSEYWQKSLHQMDGQTRRMTRLVEDLLMLSRLEDDENSLVQDAVAVPAMLSALIEDARILSGDRKHHITLDCDQSLWLKGSEKELSSAFSNILFNAVQYTPEAGHIDVSWLHEDGNAIFEVKDDGVGILPVHVHRLTERFYRVDAGRSRAAGGTGLGLAIVKHVLDRHGAKLVIESEPGVGSTFRCVFPGSLAIYREKSA
jgi:two-component system phosphate regulon sensor histidine kinase PhoR